MHTSGLNDDSSAQRVDGVDVPIDGAIVRATADDAAELLVLQRCCWVQEAIDNETLEIAALHESLTDVRRWIDEWEVWCLRLNAHPSQRIVGAVRAKVDRGAWEIGRLMVAPDQAGRGLGRWMLNFIESRAPGDIKTFSLFTGARSTRNISIYQKAGYELSASEDVPAAAVSLSKKR